MYVISSTFLLYFIFWKCSEVPCAGAFSLPGHYRHASTTSRYYTRIANDSNKGRLALCSTNPNQELSRSQDQSNIFILSFDGVVADTNYWRSNLAIAVAFETWPQLCKDSSIVSTSSSSNSGTIDDGSNDGLEWLRNKLCALMQVSLSDEDGLLGCEAVLMARLILEEQELDGGRSNGCSGKYGSLFHPSSLSQSTRSANVGSRPLTVGEIAVNWNDGACLKDTVRIKYNVNGKDPMPIIRQNILKFLKHELQQQKEHGKSQMLPQIHSFVADTLLDCASPVFILIGNESHASTAKSSLEKLSLPIHILGGDEMKHRNDSHQVHLFQKRGVFLIAPEPQGGRGHEGVLEDIISLAPEKSLVHFIHSDIRTLQRAKSLFGDDRPRLGMFGKCVNSKNNNVGLKLSLLSICSSQPQQNEAEMDPWLNLLQEFEFVEALTSRVSSTRRSTGSSSWE